MTYISLCYQTDIQYWDDTLHEEIDAISTLIDRISNVHDPIEKSEMIERCKSKIRSATGTKRSFKMEIRLVQDVGNRRQYEARLQQLDQQLQTYQADIKASESDMNRNELFNEADTANNGMNGNNGLNNEQDAIKGGDKMLADASNIQDKTQDALSNTKQLITEAKEVGISTLEELQRQREVLHNIEKETDRLDDNLARAEQLLKAFGKRMAGDQFIQCFTVVNVLLFVGVLIYAIFVKPDKSDPNAGNPSNPANTAPTRRIRERQLLLSSSTDSQPSVSISLYIESMIQSMFDYVINYFYNDQHNDETITTTTFSLRGSSNNTTY